MPLAATVRVWTAPPTVIALVLFAVELAWFALNFSAQTGPPILGTAPVILGSAVAALAMGRAWRAPGMTAAAARFWRTMTLASAAIVVAQLTDLPGYLVTPSTRPNPVSLAVYGVAMIAVVTAFYRLPLESRGAGGKTRLLLDCATVTVAALLIIWYAALTRMPAGDASKLLATTAVASVALGLVVLALAKVVFSGGRTIDLLALRALGFGLALQMAGVFVTPLILDRPQIAGEPLGRSAMYVLVAAAAGYQIRAARRSGTQRRKTTERAFSVLPYLAVAVVDAVLLYAIRGQDDATVVVGGGAVALTVLVVARQLAAFRENNRLIAEVRSYHDQLAYQATHDSLTRLANRALFAGELEAAVADPGRDGCWLALVDLDGFKAVNDTFGHHTGDGLLVEVADRLRAGVRPGDLVARLGGDEFAVLLRGLPDGDVDDVVGRMLVTLQQPLTVDGHDLAVRASVGVVDAAREDDPTTLMRHADAAMYQAKRTGKGRFARYRGDDRVTTAERQPSR
jgi:diguanylate cyclase (GGDEF)-like protein